MTLNDLSLGGRGRILDVTGDDAIALRLMEMGLTEDEPIEFLGKAPLGDPLEFLIRGYRISLRQTEAARVLVEPLPAVCYSRGWQPRSSPGEMMGARS